MRRRIYNSAGFALAKSGWLRTDRSVSYHETMGEVKNNAVISEYSAIYTVFDRKPRSYCISSHIEQIDGEIQIAREEHPRAVGELEKSRCFVSSVESHGHCYDQYIEDNDPDEREQPPFEREEEYRPQQIDGELGVVCGTRIAVVELF